ncbi:hypothetical protein HMN09_00121100 [Mycena chlorophos]|uniref:DUF6593 domain-containing protein n=1 Tax=Mycena chlorophos TaxID=658473 RepID=A0A8H6WN28_MYCCL|nr:hypothetical protein HMN09_00121100 [Mycena chlorophos]
MFLVLTTPSTSNTTYTDEFGIPQYQVDTRATRTSRATSIQRVLRREATAFDVFALNVPRASTQEVATIRWNLVHSTVVTFANDNVDHKTKTWLRHEDVQHGLSLHILTARDGNEYRWSQDRETGQLQLRTTDAEEALVACFHKKHVFPEFLPNRPLAALEVLDGFEKMVDEILVTFIYVDNRRHKSHSRSPTRSNST